jgi:alkaline phosphatase D
VVWDDHELANDAWSGGAGNHNPDQGEGDWNTRRAAAYRAYVEWMPVREQAATGIRLYRQFRFGDLADVLMLDTRGLRDRQVPGTDFDALVNPKRTLLGAEQESWLFDRLRTSQQSGTRWRVLGQQIMFAPLTPPGIRPQNTDVWEGYPAARQRVFEFLASEKIGNVAILTGDVHSSWAWDVPRNAFGGYNNRTGEGSLAVELVAPAISSPPLFSDANARERTTMLRLVLPHLKYLEGQSHGYVLTDIGRDRLQATWYFVQGVDTRSDSESKATSFVCERGSSRLVPA